MDDDATEITRTMECRSDLYVLMVDMLENETGDLFWFIGDWQIQREEGGLTIWHPPHPPLHFTAPGAAGDYLDAAGCYQPGAAMIGRMLF